MQLQITIFFKTSSTYRRKERGFVEDWLCYFVAWCLGDAFRMKIKQHDMCKLASRVYTTVGENKRY